MDLELTTKLCKYSANVCLLKFVYVDNDAEI